jgi:ribosomal protein L37AE/L43A
MQFQEILIAFLPFCILPILVLMIGVAISYLLLNRTYRRYWNCPECEKKAAGEIIDSIEEVISNKVDYTLRNPVRMKEIRITDHYQCKECKHTWTRSFTKRERVREHRVTRT